MKRRSQAEHDREVEYLSKALKNKEGRLCLAHPTALSNLTRSTPYKKRCSLVDIDHLNAIITIDSKTHLAIVEPRVTMEQLVSATLKENLLPQVVPEFRAITVGGALMGGALESSSHRYGLFSDSCEWCEVLLGNGDKLTTSATLYPDLFAALCGSYGTLGIITLVAIRLIDAKRFVHLSYQLIDQPSKLLTSDALYLDAIAMKQNHLIAMKATLTDAPHHLPRYSMKYPWSQWFYQHAQEARDEAISIKDYLFRYDRAAFWMGQFLLRAKPLILYLLCRPHSRKKLHELLKHQKPAVPSPLFRWLFGWAMSTRSLYKALHRVPNSEIAQTYLIQDCLIGADQVDAFLQEIEEAYDLFPLWLCPVKKTAHPQLLAPHCLNTKQTSLINVGLYGIPLWEKGAADATRDLEKRVERYGGRKALYSHSYYNEESFWSIYDKNQYDQLRQTYYADKTFPSLSEKVLSL